MTIDDRLNRLVERHEALAQSLELLTTDVREMGQNLQVLYRLAQQDGENIRALARVAESHERCLTDLEGSE